MTPSRRWLLPVSLVAACLVVLTAPASASRPKESPAARKARVLEGQLKSTQRELARTRTTLATTRQTLARTRTELADAIRTRDSALVALAEAPTARDTLSGALDAAIAERDRRVIPRSELDRAVASVETEVSYLEHTLRSRDVTAAREHLLALSAMGYVVGHVSAPLYGYRNEIAGDARFETPEEILASGAGICGSAAWTMAAILARFDLPVRSVQFFQGDDNHIAIEVRYDGAWHYYDPTWGAMYLRDRQVLSIGAARRALAAGEEVELVYDHTLPWRTISDQLGILDVRFATDPATRVVRGDVAFDA